MKLEMQTKLDYAVDLTEKETLSVSAGLLD